MVCVLLSLAFAPTTRAAYYLPGVTPNTWEDGEVVTLKTNKVTSTKTPLQYDYCKL